MMRGVNDLSEYQEVLNIAKFDGIFDYVTKVNEGGESDLYEISCHDGTYIAQGFISHNSYVHAAFTTVMRSFYATPQLALIDQLLNDPNLRGRFVDIKGRQNYRCYYAPQRTVNAGKCETEDYPCSERFDVCPYWIQKRRAMGAPSVLMSLAYLVLEGTTEGESESYLGSRTLLVLDEAHNLEEQCLSYVSLQFAPFAVPYQIYDKFLPKLRKVNGRLDMEQFLEIVAEYMKRVLGGMIKASEERGLSVAEVEDKRTIGRFLEGYKMFRSSKEEWVWRVWNDQLLLQPVFAREFMKQLVWKRAANYIISSATILDPAEYVVMNGLTDLLKEDEIEFLTAPSTFPAANRPVIDSTVGPLSMQQWEHNMPKAIDAVALILRKEKGSVAVHCSTYKHQRAIMDNLPSDLRKRLISHTSRDREEKLKEWLGTRGKIFVSVAFNEGQDWAYEKCSAQVLFKVPFPDLSDRRIKRRLEMGRRQWYVNQAMLSVIQAYGRAIRAEDDKAKFYVVDGSFVQLVRDCWNFIPDWFKEVLPLTLTPKRPPGAAQ